LVLANFRNCSPSLCSFITLTTYLFFFLLFACLACLCACLRSRTLALTTTIARVVVLSTYVILSFFIFCFLFNNHFVYFVSNCFYFPPPWVLSPTFHFCLSLTTLFTFLTCFSQLASLPACCCFCVASGLFRNFNCLGLGQLRLKPV
jgi:hypothetical protein